MLKFVPAFTSRVAVVSQVSAAIVALSSSSFFFFPWKAVFNQCVLRTVLLCEVQWPNGERTGLQVKQFRLEPWPESLHCVLGQDI